MRHFKISVDMHCNHFLAPKMLSKGMYLGIDFKFQGKANAQTGNGCAF